MAKERPGAIAVVLGMAGGWAGRWGAQSCGGLPAGRGQPPAHMASPGQEPQPLLQAGRALPGASPMASHPGVGPTGQVGPVGAVALATGPLAGLIVGRAIPRWGAGGSDIALPTATVTLGLGL